MAGLSDVNLHVSRNTWLPREIDLDTSASSWQCCGNTAQHLGIPITGAQFVHVASPLFMRGKLQSDPNEVWIFGFGSIIYKQGSSSRHAGIGSSSQ